jgi:hypothetical protein
VPPGSSVDGCSCGCLASRKHTLWCCPTALLGFTTMLAHEVDQASIHAALSGVSYGQTELPGRQR